MAHRTLTVIATLNRPAELEIALGSLLGQPTDVFVVGTPIPERVVADWSRAFAFGGQRLILEEREVDLTGKNRGYEYAEENDYEFVFGMDDDNVVTNGYIANLVHFLDGATKVAGVSGFIQTFAAGKEARYAQWSPDRDTLYTQCPFGDQTITLTDDNRMAFTQRVQVLGFSGQEYAMNVDYFVNSWMHRVSMNRGLRLEMPEVIGEEIDMTYRRMRGSLWVIPWATMYHMAAPVGGTRETKDLSMTPEVREAAWRGLARRWGFGEPEGIVEYMTNGAIQEMIDNRGSANV